MSSMETSDKTPILTEEIKIEYLARSLSKMYYAGYNTARNNKYTSQDIESMTDSEWPKFTELAKEIAVNL